MIPLQPQTEDDPDFVDQVRWILSGAIDQYDPAEVYVLWVRGWFDYKWCYFTGKTLGALGVSKFCNLTLPPFVPGRILRQDHYDRVGPSGDTFLATTVPPLHIHQRSEANFKRYLHHTSDNGVFLWCSGGSKVPGRGSMMLYRVSPRMKFGWHVTFLKKDRWQIEKVTFTSKPHVEALRRVGCSMETNV